MSILESKREIIGYSREDISRILNCPSNTIGRWERLERMPTGSIFYEVILCYQLTSDEVVEYIKEVYNKTKINNKKYKEESMENIKEKNKEKYNMYVELMSKNIYNNITNKK